MSLGAHGSTRFSQVAPACRWWFRLRRRASRVQSTTVVLAGALPRPICHGASVVASQFLLPSTGPTRNAGVDGAAGGVQSPSGRIARSRTQSASVYTEALYDWRSSQAGRLGTKRHWAGGRAPRGLSASGDRDQPAPVGLSPDRSRVGRARGHPAPGPPLPPAEASGPSERLALEADFRRSGRARPRHRADRVGRRGPAGRAGVPRAGPPRRRSRGCRQRRPPTG